MQIPMLPDSAPFSPGQRAWLNGFFAGLLGFDGSATPGSVLPGMLAAVPGAMPQAAMAPSAEAPPPPPEEEFPWHDPALPLDERLALAEGKSVERRLMAAMAQLDCGACGYLCQTYSELLARGEEKDHTRCTPGGKETARKLKELLAARGNSAPPPTPAPAVNGSHVNGSHIKGAAANGQSVEKPGTSRAHPFTSQLVACRPLNQKGSQKDTRHVVISLAGSGLHYEPGDSLGVYPENCPELVDEVLAALAFTGDEPVRSPDGSSRSLREALCHCYALARPSNRLIELLAAQPPNASKAAQLQTLLEDDPDNFLETADTLDLLRRFPSGRPSAADFAAALTPLQPRLYSISSSLRAHPEEVHLTVGVVRYRFGDRLRKGVASTFLADRLNPGGKLRVFLQRSHFRLPTNPETPVIMVGPGTGIAPFRAFLQERHATKAGGKNWLFFGDQCRNTDLLFEDELQAYQQCGLLSRLDLAFSRDQAEKVYVQHRMLAASAELWSWLEHGAHFYVCGDANRMALDVDRALQQIIAQHSGRSPEEAKVHLASLAKAGRYQRDVY